MNKQNTKEIGYNIRLTVLSSTAGLIGVPSFLLYTLMKTSARSTACPLSCAYIILNNLITRRHGIWNITCNIMYNKFKAVDDYVQKDM